MKKKLIIFVAVSVTLAIIYYAYTSLFLVDGKITNLASKIQKEVNVQATDVASCNYIGMGARLCGGPGTYLVYSTENTDEEKLRELVNEYNILSSERSRKQSESGLSGICVVPNPPKIELINGECLDN